MVRMTYLKLRLPGQTKTDIAEREKAVRMRRGLTQEQLATKADVSLGSLRRFEQTGDISLSSLISISFALGCQAELDGLFKELPYRSVQEVLDDAKRQET